MSRVERADSKGDGIPRGRKNMSKGGDSGKKATSPEGSEEGLSDASHPGLKGFSLSHA